MWANYEYAWGGIYSKVYKTQYLNNIEIKDYELQPLKFQGQSLDIETGLHYNRFRYYDSDVGMFIQRDPIGLLGGVNVFAYAPNPIGWVDPFGLCTDATPVAHNSTELSQAVINRRKQDNNFNAKSTNYAAAKVRNRDGTIEIITDRNIPGTPMHAEMVLIGKADENRQIILELYSERKPCGECKSHINLTKNSQSANITYTYPYENNDLRTNSESRRQLQKFLDQFKG